MQQQLCVFATPCYGFNVSLETHLSILKASHLLKDNNIGVVHHLIPGDQFIANVRNRMVTDFLEIENATDLFFIDDDVGFDPNVVLRFISADYDVLSGIYPQKTDAYPQTFPVELSLDSGNNLIKDGVFFQANSIPGGFTRIKRHVIERLAENEPIKYEWPEFDGSKKMHYPIFETGVNKEAKQFWGEDFVFSQKVRSAGFTIWVDPTIEFSHRGQKKYSGVLQNSIDKFYDRKFLDEKKD